MRDRAEWMNKASIPVLELLAEADVALSAGSIVHNLQVDLTDAPSRATIYRALDPLEEHGLVGEEGEKSSHYRITSEGRAYLEGERDASALDGPEERG